MAEQKEMTFEESLDKLEEIVKKLGFYWLAAQIRL